MSETEQPVLSPEQEDELAVTLARSVIDELAPEERALFEATVAGRSGDRRAAGRDVPLGIGVDTVAALTPYLLLGATAALRLVASMLVESAKSEVQPVLDGWLRRLIHGRPRADRRRPAPEPPVLPPDARRRITDVTFDVCRGHGLNADDALDVANAIAWRLAPASR